MVKNVNFNGYSTPAAITRRARRALSLESFIAILRETGMSDQEIVAVISEMKVTKLNTDEAKRTAD